MYAKYSTDALVLGSAPRGEADRTVFLYTREFGLVRARASAVRRESSRMRYALAHYSAARVSLVRGLSGWRVAGAAARRSVAGGANGMPVFARIAHLVLRLVPGEERNDQLFSILDTAQQVCAEGVHEVWPTIELVTVARILHALGYLSGEALGRFAMYETYDRAALSLADMHRGELLASVNRALAETQL
jgi:recombinational DNA repair protein (RecF pathway)